MRTNHVDHGGVFSGAIGRATLAMAAGLLIGTAAQAESTTLVAVNNPAVPSSFTLDFGGFGGVASALVATTDIAFEVDADTATARFVEYRQEVEALTLPGGFSTGNLLIEIVDGSSAGTYNELTGEFNTEEMYAIHFEGDLSAFGLESPVFLPSTSRGFVTLSADSGEINLDWEGDGLLANPVDPNTPLEFEYTCRVAATFTPEPVSLVRLAMVPEVINLELRSGVENNLVTKLLVSADSLNRGRNRTAVRMLGAFSNSVAALSGRHIAEADAGQLIDAADAVIDMLGGTVRASAALGTTPVKAGNAIRSIGSQ